VLGERCTHAHEHMPEWVGGACKEAPVPICDGDAGMHRHVCDPLPQIEVSASQQATMMMQQIPLMALPTYVINQQVVNCPINATVVTESYSSQAYGGEFGDSPPPSPRMLLEACECGQMFMKDCRFCRMCGKKRHSPKPVVCGCGTVFLSDSLFCHCCGTGRCSEPQAHASTEGVHDKNEREDTDAAESVSAESTAATDNQSERRTSHGSQQTSPRTNWADVEDENALGSVEVH